MEYQTKQERFLEENRSHENMCLFYQSVEGIRAVPGFEGRKLYFEVHRHSWW